MSQRYSFFDGEVTVTTTAPSSLWLESEHITKLVWDEVNPIPEEGLALLSFPATVYSGCPAVTPASAEELIRTIRSDHETTEPIAALVGGIDALMMDAVIRPRATDFCDWRGNILISEDSRICLGGEGVRMRLYVLDLPGATQRTLLITIFGRDDRLDEVIAAAAPILDSFESSAAAP